MKKFHWLIIIICLWLAFLLRVWGLSFGLPYKFHTDEPLPIETVFKWYTDGELVFRHFVNPPLFTYVLASAFWPWVTFTPIISSKEWASQTVFFARLWSVFFGVLTVALAYPLGKRVYNRQAGLVGVILLTGLFLPARESHFAVSDALVTFLVLLAIYFSVNLLWHQRWSNYIAAGVAVGLAVGAKLTGGLVVLALLVAHILVYPTLRNRAHKRLFVSLLVALVTFLVVAIPFFGTPKAFILEIIRHLFEIGPEGYKGMRIAPGTGWEYYVQVLGWGMDWLLLLVVVAALVGVVIRRNKCGIIMAAFPLAFFAYMGGQLHVFARFILPAIPPLVVLAAAEMVVWQERWVFWRQRQLLVWPLVIGLVVVQSLANLIWFDHLLTLPDTRQLATEWFLNQFPEGTIVAKERFSIFNTSYFLDERWPYTIINMDRLYQAKYSVDTYMVRKVEIVVLSNFTFDQKHRDSVEDNARQKGLVLLDQNATLIKTFDPYISDYGWFYHDQIYGPAGETLQRTHPGPLIKVYRLPEVNHYYKVDELDITVPLKANFADQIHLLGYDLPQIQVKAGEAFPVTLYWQAPLDESPEADFVQFNHLYDSRGILRGGYDRQPLEYYNTQRWVPGEIVIDGYAVPVDADAPPGQYYLDVGYYLTVEDSPINLPLIVDGQMAGESSVTIGPVEVVVP